MNRVVYFPKNSKKNKKAVEYSNTSISTAQSILTYKRLSNSAFFSSKPGLPSKANIFTLYASTPG